MEKSQRSGKFKETTAGVREAQPVIVGDIQGIWSGKWENRVGLQLWRKREVQVIPRWFHETSREHIVLYLPKIIHAYKCIYTFISIYVLEKVIFLGLKILHTKVID